MGKVLVRPEAAQSEGFLATFPGRFISDAKELKIPLLNSGQVNRIRLPWIGPHLGFREVAGQLGIGFCVGDVSACLKPGVHLPA